jgi:hypothetical protein
MTWEIGFSREAEKFLKLENIRSQAVEEIKNGPSLFRVGK